MKRFLKIFILLFFAISIVGCGARGEYNKDTSNGGDVADETLDQNTELLSSPNRKIIYTVQMSLYVDDLNMMVDQIQKSINKSEEWFDNLEIRNNNAYFTIRVKTSRLDEYISSISKHGDVHNYSKHAKDVSLEYQDNEAKILSLQAELNRLYILYDQASIGEMIELNKRITQVNTDLTKLKGELNKFDSLVDYSVVNITIYATAKPAPETFGNKLRNAFNAGWKGFVALIQGILLVLTALVPFLIIIVPVGATIIIVHKKNQKNRLKKDHNSKI